VLSYIKDKRGQMAFDKLRLSGLGLQFTPTPLVLSLSKHLYNV
jgi:hypothetical protein